MLIMTQIFKVKSCSSVFKEEFRSKKRKWETANSESGVINDGFYYMQNDASDNTACYRTNSPLKSKEDFLIDTSIEIVNHNNSGYFGLAWGIDKDFNHSNRFTMSFDGENSLIITREKNSEINYSRFESKISPKITPAESTRFSVVKLGMFYYFLINNKIINVVNNSQFVYGGPFLGYYVEPGLCVKSKYLEVKKIIADENEAVVGLNLLLD
jgi:hypothetical protein